MANVSWVCPTIHPDLAIAPEGAPGHSILFRDAAATPRADETTLLAATLVAQTAVRAVRRSRRSSRRPGPRSGTTPHRPGGVRRRSERRPVLPSAAARPAGRRISNRRRPQRDGDPPRPIDAAAVSRRFPWPSAPTTPLLDLDFAAANGWDAEFETYGDFDLPTYVGPSTFMKLPWITDPGRAAPPRASTSRSSARRSTTPSATGRAPASGRGRSARRSTRRARSTRSSSTSTPFDVLTVVDAGDANIVPAWIERGHAMIYRKVREVAETGAIPIVLGGDHSITWPAATAIAEVRRPGSIGIVHFDAHADTANDDCGRAGQPRHADAPPHRVGRGQGQELRPGRAARLLAAARDLRLDAGAGPALALHARDRGARRRGGHRPGHRRGARRPRLDLPEARHRRHRPGHGARAPGRPSRAAC